MTPTKIHIAVYALGNPPRLIPTPGQVHDSTQADALVDGFVPGRVIADKAYDTNQFKAFLAFRAEAVIPSLGSRKEPAPYDKHRYKERHLVECFINKIEYFRRVATRYDETVASFLGFVAISAVLAEAIADLLALGRRSMRLARLAGTLPAIN